MRAIHWIFIAVATLFSLSLVMIYSTTSADILDHGKNNHLYEAVAKQLFYAFAGFILGWGIYKMGWFRFLESSPWILAALSFLLLCVLIPGIGRTVNGSKRWLMIAGVSLQPSEFVKYLLPLFFIERTIKKEQVTFDVFFKLLGWMSIPILLILLEPNNGTVLVILATLIALFFILRVRAVFWILPLGIIFLVTIFAATRLDYVSKRLDVWRHPEKDLLGKGHQPYQAKVAAGSGGIFGRGVGNSLQKLSYLPEAQNDYIAAIFAEEFGFMGVAFLIGLYALIVIATFKIICYQKMREAVAVGSVILFLSACQACLNLAVVSGLFPSTGLNLPFFSQGGSSLVANCMGLGLLVSLAENNPDA